MLGFVTSPLADIVGVANPPAGGPGSMRYAHRAFGPGHAATIPFAELLQPTRGTTWTAILFLLPYRLPSTCQLRRYFDDVLEVRLIDDDFLEHVRFNREAIDTNFLLLGRVHEVHNNQ